MNTASANDLLLDLRARCPAAARRLDAAAGVELRGPTAVLRLPEGAWGRADLERFVPELEEAARAVLGPGGRVHLEAAAAAPEALPFAVRASKLWNHAAFWAWEGKLSAVLAVRKPLYEEWLRADVASLPADADAFVRSYRVPSPSEPPLGLLPRLLDELCALAREGSSYAQLVVAFPGDPAADLLEARLYAVRDWGTPREPASVLRKYTGRIHYASPHEPPLGLRLARGLLGTAR